MNAVLKWVGKLISRIAKTILAVIMAMLLLHAAFFTWRAGQPLELPQFNGRTYYEVLAGRKAAYDALAAAYQASHPGIKVKPGVCYFSESSILTLVTVPIAGYYALAGIYPGLRVHIIPGDLRNGYVPEDVTWLNLLPAWWRTFEKFTWGVFLHVPQTPVPYCRIAPAT